MALFLNSMSEEQRTMYFNLHSQSAPHNGSPEPREEPQATTSTTSTSATYCGTSWFNLKAARPTNVEVEVMTATLAACNWGHDLDKWLAEAEIDAPRMSKLGDEWAPLPNSTVYSSKGKVLAPLELALTNNYVASQGGDGTIETVVSALGRRGIILSLSSVHSYYKALLKPGKHRLKGPPRDGGRTTSPRYVSAIPAIVELLRAERRQIRQAVTASRFDVSHEVKMTHVEVIEQMEVERAGHREAITNLQTKFDNEREANRSALQAKQVKLDAANKGWSKERKLKETAVGKVKGTAKRVRDEEKAKAAEKVTQ